MQSTYARIISRTSELAKERAANPAGGSGEEVEQIQLHAVDPGTEIMIQIPSPAPTTTTTSNTSSDSADKREDIEIKAREVFETFPPGLQRAMESKSLDRINEVLGKMSVSEAEEVVEKMGEHGMLSMERGVIDGTTEEGRQRLKELEEEGKRPKDGQTEEKRGEGEVEVADVD